MSNLSDLYPDWQEQILSLSLSAWSDLQMNSVKVDQWLRNFTGASQEEEIERKHAMHLLTQFIYFGKREVEECLKVLYQEKFLYPHIQNAKREGVDTALIEKTIKERLRHKTRFVGVGNPAESGTSLLYHFRKINCLPVCSFATLCDAVKLASDKAGTPVLKLNPPSLEQLVLIDDFCGTGDQVIQREEKNIKVIKHFHPNVQVHYLLLAATERALQRLRSCNIFDNVEAVVVLDHDYRAFSPNSQYYKNSPHDISKIEAEKIMRYYGKKLCPSIGLTEDACLGYKDCQLLVGFNHNTPDNSLPTFWCNSSDIPWRPIFTRHNKF